MTNKCTICGEPMPENETMFNYHGLSGPCPKPPVHTPTPPADAPVTDEARREALATMPHNRLSPSFPEHLVNWWKAWGPTVNAALSAPSREKELKRVIAQAALCVFEGKTGINDTIWLNNHVTLYEHLVGELNLELTGEYEHDRAALIAAAKGEK